jgi:phosphotriesterase-related protein
MHDRREFLGSLAALAALPSTLLAQDGSVATVTGGVAVRDLGMVLMHEHVMVDFVGAAKVSRSRYDADEVMRVALPHLKEAHELGCRTLVECTPAFLGRDAALLQRLSQESGLRIIANTGYYGAAADKHLPAHAFRESAGELAQHWIDEHERGIDDTGILPGILKIGVDPGDLSDIDRKLVQAAAIAHKATGLPIASHTVDGTAAHQSLDVLDAAGVPAGAYIWVHAQNEGDDALLKGAAKRGAWVEFDGIGPDSVDRHVQLVKMMAEADHLGRVLVSHDAGWYHVGESGGGTFRPFDTVFRRFVPAIREALNEAAVTRLLVTNPASALARR